MTYKACCNLIAEVMNFVHRPVVRITGEDVWQVSPSGEIWPIMALWSIYILREGWDPAVTKYVTRLVEGRKLVRQ